MAAIRPARIGPQVYVSQRQAAARRPVCTLAFQPNDSTVATRGDLSGVEGRLQHQLDGLQNQLQHKADVDVVQGVRTDLMEVKNLVITEGADRKVAFSVLSEKVVDAKEVLSTRLSKLEQLLADEATARKLAVSKVEFDLLLLKFGVGALFGLVLLGAAPGSPLAALTAAVQTAFHP